MMNSFGNWTVDETGNIDNLVLGYHISSIMLLTEDWVSHISEKNSLFELDMFVKAFRLAKAIIQSTTTTYPTL